MAKSALVTGGGRGIGRAIVDQLMHEDLRVTACGRGARPADFPEGAFWIQADVSVPTDAVRLVREATEAMGSSVSVLVNNAGVQVERNLLESTDDDWDLVVRQPNYCGFSVTVCVRSKALFRRHSCSKSRKSNAVCGLRQSRPKGATEPLHGCVAALDNGKHHCLRAAPCPEAALRT